MRSIWKGCFFKKNNLVLNRSSTVVNTLFKNNIGVYNGKEMKTFSITRYMLGLKIGEFFFTRKLKVVHKKKKIDRKSKKK